MALQEDRMVTRSLVSLSLLLLLAVPLSAREGDELVGRRAPDLQLTYWVNSAPLLISDLTGKVVLLRWWTDTCPFCAATAPALRELESKFGPAGLQVIGVFHPKPAGDWNVERVRAATARLGFTFPVAIDGDWSALKRWWLDSGNREYTSVSFILDKHGIIRYVHPGGEYHMGKCTPGQEHCAEDFRAIEMIISQLLAEK
jgi:peroxiredoxin